MVGTGGNTVAACTNVRPTGTEWDEASCDQWATETSECESDWMVNGDYCSESCGRCTSTGDGDGDSGDGDTSSGGSSVVIDSSCSQGSSQVCSNQIGNHCNYTFEYWKDQGTGCLVNTNDGFEVEWSDVSNLLGRKGRRPGSRNEVVHFDADYNPDGNSYLCVYGWARNPLVEYYIVDSWGSWRPPGDEGLQGTITSDGGTYEVYRVPRTGPSIDGNNTTFTQYWSVRTERRESGTITVGNHFTAWDGYGMTLGEMYEVSMTVEGYMSSGSAKVRFEME